MTSDSIADFLIRIKNGYLAKKSEVEVSYSKANESLAKILREEGYLEEWKIENGKWKTLRLTLKYKGKKPVLTEIQRISKPGLRIYTKKTKIPKILGGLGTIIISTPGGLMTGKEAKTKSLGGEVLCKVW